MLVASRQSWSVLAGLRGVGFAVALWVSGLQGHAQLFTNLQALVSVLPAGRPGVALEDGPKDIASADFDSDGLLDLAISNIDGTVTVYFGEGSGRFGNPVYLLTGSHGLRGVICADLNQDSRPDIAVAAPRRGKIHLYYSSPQRHFTTAAPLEAWIGARNLEAGDFNGDGRTDLVVGGPNNGLRYYEAQPSGGFAARANLAELDVPNPDLSEDLKPVFSLRAFRVTGTSQDALIATHAFGKLVWICQLDFAGNFNIQGILTNRTAAYGVDVGPVRSLVSGAGDLVTVHRDEGTVEIHEASLDHPSGFEPQPIQTLSVPGGPRAARIVDLDGDGWNDLVVVVRNFDLVLTYKNNEGTFSLATERPVGRSPRELTVSPFDGDDFPDVAIMNRWSSDVNVLLTYPQQAGFAGINHLYLADGDVAGLSVYDFNRDGRDDVIQLHRASGDFSVRLAAPDGSLAPPVFYTIGQLPAAQIIVDVNNDHVADQVATHLGTEGIEQASVSVRLGAGDGRFGDEQRFYLPPEIEGRLFALVPADLDGNGSIDLAAGFLDARLAFFEGAGDGTFTFRRVYTLTNEMRGLVAGDFDLDTDPDLAGVGISGTLVIIENDQHFFDGTVLLQQSHPPPLAAQFGARTVKAIDLNEDGDLDLVVGSGQGAILYRGGPGLAFVPQEDFLPGTDFPVASVITADFDGQGREDIVVACRVLDCVSLLTQTEEGTFQPTLTLPVPSSSYLATGDLDGDGYPDLVGSGHVLWTALSSQAPVTTAPLRPIDTREGIPGLVINELLAINNKLPVALDGDRNVDWVELYNGGASSLLLNGWRLRAASPDGTNEFVFPATAFMGKTNHLLVFFAPERRTIYHTGFKLNGSGGTLTLMTPQGATIDEVRYPPQRDNISYARYRDGLRSFVFNPFPSPRRSNPDNGRVEPLVRLQGVNGDSLQPAQPIRFFASVRDDVGVASASILYQRLDSPGTSFQRIPLYDDGRHEDGASSDGQYSGLLEGGLPTGAEIQLYLEVVDLSEQIVTVPEELEVGLPGIQGNLPTLAIGFSKLPIELSEIVPLNERSYTITINGESHSPDWIEVRNLSPDPISLNGVGIGFELTDLKPFFFPTGAVLSAGEHLLVLCDNDPSLGPLHTSFHISSLGEHIVLFQSTTNRGRVLIDEVRFGSLELDEAWARLGAKGPWGRRTPTPETQNVVGPSFCWTPTSGTGSNWTFAIPTVRGQPLILDMSPSLVTPHWSRLLQVEGDGIERAIAVPTFQQGFFRFVTEP